MAVAAVACTLGCVDMAPYRPFQASTVGEDPDALYSAAVRVLVRRGWGIVSADRRSRDIRTRWVPFRDLGLPAGESGRDYAGSIRVTITDDTVAVFTACDWMNEFDRLGRFQACPDGERPQGLHDKEVELVGMILDESHAAAKYGRLADPPPLRRAPLPPVVVPATIVTPVAVPATQQAVTQQITQVVPIPVATPVRPHVAPSVPPPAAPSVIPPPLAPVVPPPIQPRAGPPADTVARAETPYETPEAPRQPDAGSVAALDAAAPAPAAPARDAAAEDDAGEW